MSYYLKSTTQKTYDVLGQHIPACVTPNNDYLKVSDAIYEKFRQMPVIRSLIEAGAIFATKTEPAEVKNSLQGLTSSNAALIAKNTELELKVKALEAKQKENSGDSDRIATLEAEWKAKYEALEAKYAALEKEATEALAVKEKEIAKLNKKLAKEE